MSARDAIPRSRLPFSGLLLAAALGILTAHVSGIPSSGFLAGAAASLTAWLSFRRTRWILLCVAMGFACVHVWQTRESFASRFAVLLGGQAPLVTVKGTVASDPAPYGKDRERFTLRVISLAAGGQEIPFPADVMVSAKAPAPARADFVEVTGPLATIPPPRNPGAFDMQSWMRLQGVTCSIQAASAADVIILSPAPWYSIPALASRCRAWMETTLRVGISDEPVVCDLIAGMVLGVTSSIPDDLQQEFRNTGTFHLFSVSGLHVGMIALILWQVMKTAGAGRRSAAAVIIPALFFYALITGWKPSSLRAAAMASIFLAGLAASRQPVPLNSLCAAGFLILAQSTRELFNPGFQLSFLVVFSILVLARPIQRAIRSVVHPDPFLPREIWSRRERARAAILETAGGLVAVSLAAWTGSLPLTLYYFHLVSLSALPANLAIIPLAFLIMVTACLSLAGGLVSSFLASVFNNANLVFTKVLLLIVQSAASLPLSHFPCGLPETGPAVVTVFDFGAGGAAAVEAEGKILLIDTGPARARDGVILPWLRARGRDRPDIIVLTHGDSRHIGAAPAFVDGARTPRIVDSGLDDRSPVRAALHRQLQASGLPKSIVRAGDVIPVAPCARLAILHPPAGLQRNEADDKALIVRLDAAGSRILFLSDAGPPTLAWLTENAGDAVEADVLVMGRHGSGLLPDRGFLQRVAPRAVIATAAAFPESEALDPGWAALLSELGIPLFRQDECGAVRLEISRKAIRMSGFVNRSGLSLGMPDASPGGAR